MKTLKDNCHKLFLYPLLFILLQVEERIILRKNPCFARRDRKSILFKATCYYCSDKYHIRPLFHIRNVKVHNGYLEFDT